MPNSGIQKLSGENEMAVGTAVSFFVSEGDDKKPADGEIIGIKDEIATVVYISPSGEYSIDKFDKSKLKLKIKGEEDSENLETNNTNTKIDTEEIEETDLEAEKLILEEEEKENRRLERLDKIKEVKIQKIKNALISIPKNELTKNILKKINITLEELHFSLEPFQQIQSIDELSDEDIEILSEDLDFINELMFISFIDFSIANKKEKPSQLHIKEIKTRITHFDTQAKKLRDKRIEEFNQNLYTQRTENEKKYPNPLKMMNIGELTDQKANQLKIDPKHQKIFNKILYREKQKRDEFSNNLVKKIVERRKDLIHLLKSENQSESDNKSKFLKIIPELHSMLLPIQESEENNKNLELEEIHEIVYKELLELEDNKTENLEETKNLEQLNNIQHIEKYIKLAMETPFKSIAGIQQFGEKEGLQTLIFKQISSIINVALWTKQFSIEKNIDTNITKETIKTSIQLYGKAFLTNFIKPSNNTNSENIQNLTDILSNTAISFFDDLQNNTTEVAIDTLKTNFLQKFPDIIKKIIPLELKKDDIVIYTDESGTKHEATILSISKNLVLTDPKYHIAISINGNPKILSTEKNSKEISQLKLK